MAEHLIVCGHGQSDPGAGGNGINERDWTRHPLIVSIRKYGGQLKKNKLSIYDTKLDMYQQTQRGWGAYSVSKNIGSVTELHLDAAGPTATGGHVIINSKYKPDNNDLAIANVIKNYIGLWGSSKPTGCYGRNNLLNLNVFADRGINYRLAELGFISSKRDTDILKRNYDPIAKELVEAITGEKLSVATMKPPANSFNINNYYTKQFAMIKLIKDDYAYKEKALKTKAGSIVKKGTILTVVGLEYSGQYPRFKLKSGLYITTRKDTIEEYKKAITYPARKVGDMVTVKKTATNYQTGQPISKFVKGSRYKIKQVKAINQSKSKRAYLLEGINSWVLEQDIQ